MTTRLLKMNLPPFVFLLVRLLQYPMFCLEHHVDLMKPLKGLLSQNLLERLSALRSQIVLIAEQTGGSALSEIQRALEEYIPLLRGLTKREYCLAEKVIFKWKNLGEDPQETSISSSYFELLSVVHMMAMLVLSEANAILVPKDSGDGGGRTVSEDCRTGAIDLLLKASGCLEYCVSHVLTCLPPDTMFRLPRDLQEGVLKAISMQALGQAVEMQLGLAIENQKATLSVKRRLACEQVSYLEQAHYCLSGCISEGYGKKHILFLKWKYLEAKAAAYYYHGLVLDKGTEPSSHIAAVYCLFAAEEVLMESKKACLNYCLAKPVTRSPPLWGIMKHLQRKIPEAASKKSEMYSYLLEQDKGLQELPDLPEFPLSLKPDDYELPEIDTLWDSENREPQAQTLKEHLHEEEEEA
ncbi:hypothetical protein H6P81_012399 [Aristolochia fimbriata]|uniref:BRO1 domain-containing protein n=1 Tax=Aristolochia fimbriata TaxID=158543 RepID=A0AAV7ECZ9_ARIFI|nr:hypothetical protein H6P81_012399 [Aristolochia fimbriata]